MRCKAVKQDFFAKLNIKLHETQRKNLSKFRHEK